MPNPDNSKRYYLFSMGPQKHLNWHNATYSSIEALELPFLVKLTKMPLVDPGLTKSQICVKITPKQHFSFFYIKPELLGDFRRLWPRLTPYGTRNLNFDTTVRMGWNQCHYENYQIPFPTTIHGSKLEFKQLRYPENRKKHVNTLSDTITFDQTIWFSFSLVF